MTDIAIDETTGDLAIANNQLVLIAGADEVTQRVRARLRMIRGEWFLNPAKGVPFRETIWVKGMPLTRIAAAIKREVLHVSGVLELLSYEQTFDSALRKLTVSLDIRATDDTIIQVSEDLAP